MHFSTLIELWDHHCNEIYSVSAIPISHPLLAHAITHSNITVLKRSEWLPKAAHTLNTPLLKECEDPLLCPSYLLLQTAQPSGQFATFSLLCMFLFVLYIRATAAIYNGIHCIVY